MKQFFLKRIKKIPLILWLLLLLIPLTLYIIKSVKFVSAFGLNADFAIGQPNTNSSSPNAGGSIGANGYDYQEGLATDGTRVFVSDCSNNRVLIYNHVPSSSGQPADVVIGQPDMTSHLANQGGSPQANTLSCPTYLATDGVRLFVSDSSNNRILIYNPIPKTNNESADLVIGQPSMTVNSPNQGNASASASSIKGVLGVSYDSSGKRLLVSDQNNNRTLIYNTIPTQDNTPADVVVGQPDMTSSSVNQGNANPSANTLYSPFSSVIANGKLFIADARNNRVLIYNNVPTSDNASADVVIGQQDKNSRNRNQGLTTAGNTLSSPSDILWDNNHLLIQDDGNNRILLFNSIPSSDNASANDTIGQTNLSNNSFGGTADTLNDPEGQIAQIGTTLLVGDSSNNRVLGYNNFLQAPIPVPTPNPSETANANFLHTDTLGTKAVLTMLKVNNILYVGGIFTKLCNTDESLCVTRNGLGAIDENTGQVTSWDPNISPFDTAEIDSLTLVNNIIYVSGSFDHVQGNARQNLAAFDSSTGMLLSFAPNINNQVTTTEAYNNILYIGGYFTLIDGNTRHNLASFDILTGSGILTNWAPPSDDNGVLKIKAHDSVLYVGGYFNTIGCYSTGSCPSQGENRSLLAAFYATTSADFLTGLNLNLNTSGGFSAFSSVESMAFCSSKFYFGGNFTGVNGQSRDDLAAVDLNTNNLLSFNPNPGPRGPVNYGIGVQNNNREVFSLSISDNNLYVGGDYSDINGLHQQSVASYNISTDSGEINPWNPYVGHYGIVDTIYPTDSHVYVGGDFSVEGLTGAIGATTSAKNLAQFNYTPSGAQDVCVETTPTATPTNTPTPVPLQANNPQPVKPYVCSDSKPGIPTNMIINPGPGAGQVTLHWTAPSGPVSDYSITYSDTADTQKWGVVSTGNVTSYVISKLPPYKNFHFWINAVNGCMPGDVLDPEVNMQVGTSASSSTVTNTGFVSRPIATQAAYINPTIPPPGPMLPSGSADIVKVGVGGAILTIIGAALLLAL